MQNVVGQEVSLSIENQPLNEVFIQLKHEHGIQFSFNDAVVSRCRVTAKRDFPSVETAIAFLVAECKFEYKKEGDVFIIRKRTNEQRTKNYSFNGRIVDALNGEPLPFSAVSVGGTGAATDANGVFSFLLKDSLATVSISHVGYFKLDTIVNAAQGIEFQLRPQSFDLKEVVVTTSEEQELSVAVERPGTIKLNQRMAVYVPGSSDNTINNLVRLQAGILASGEQSEDFTIWGTYKGQNHMLYDRITLFNISSISQNIGVVNPLIINDLEVLKGGYNVDVGDRVGGVVNVTSTTGNSKKVCGSIRISDQSTAGRLSLPLGKGFSLQLAGRFVFPQNIGTLIHNGIKGKGGKRLFGDGNLKLTGRLKNGDNFHLSLIGSGEEYNHGFSKTGYFFNSENNNFQTGGNATYLKRWNKYGTSSGSVSYSRFQANISETLMIDATKPQQDSGTFYNGSRNSISELRARIDHEFAATKYHQVAFGGSFIWNSSSLDFDTVSIPLAQGRNDVSRVSLLVKDEIFLGKIFTLQPGVKLDVKLEDPKVYFQPRMGLMLKPNKYWRLRLGWGIYYQFITENAFVDPFGNQLYFWQVADGTGTFVQQSMHSVAGISFNKWGLNVAIDGYYKTLNNLIRWSYDTVNESPFFHANGKGRSYGFDVAVRQRIWRFDLSGTYSWSRSEDAFNSISNGELARAPHDQRHETKWGATFNLKPFFLSVNYIYGSGFPVQTPNGIVNSQIYSRLDAAFLFQKQIKSIKVETGVSVLNVLNRSNLRFNQFFSYSDGAKDYQAALKLTPLVFFSVKF